MKNQKEMYEKLCIMLLKYPGGVDQYIDFRKIALKSGFSVRKLFRGKNYVSGNLSGRYEIWISVSGQSSSKAGYGDRMGEAVKMAVSHCLSLNIIYKYKE